MNCIHFLSATAAAAVIVCVSAPAQATTDLFTITGADNFSFAIPASPTVTLGSGGFIVFDVPGFPQAEDGTAWVVFYSTVNNGGLELYDPGFGEVFFAADSSQLYSVTADVPTFTPGSYTLDGAPYGFGVDTLTISAAPEPAAWATMLLGLGLAGATLRRRRSDPASQAHIAR